MCGINIYRFETLKQLCHPVVPAGRKNVGKTVYSLTRSIRDSETSIDFVQGPPGSRRERVKS